MAKISGGLHNDKSYIYASKNSVTVTGHRRERRAYHEEKGQVTKRLGNSTQYIIGVWSNGVRMRRRLVIKSLETSYHMYHISQSRVLEMETYVPPILDIALTESPGKPSWMARMTDFTSSRARPSRITQYMGGLLCPLVSPFPAFSRCRNRSVTNDTSLESHPSYATSERLRSVRCEQHHVDLPSSGGRAR